MSKVIALFGRSESGKDFLAKKLIEEGYVRVSFSDELKCIASSIFPWLPKDFESHRKNMPYECEDNVENLSPREIWKNIDFLREIDPLVFVRGAMMKVQQLIEDGRDVVITDVRKQHEYDAIKDISTKKIRILGGDTNYEDENIIETFECDAHFVNLRGRGYGAWIKFCQQHDILSVPWINIIDVMIDKQIEVNDIFSPGWKDDKPFHEQWKLAIMEEHAELLKELRPLWCWWKPSGQLDKEKALEELVDVFAFGLGSYLKVVNCYGKASEHCAMIEHRNIDSLENVHELNLLDLLNEYVHGIIDSEADVKIKYLIDYVEVCLKLLDKSLSDFNKCFMEKHDLNILRHKQGYQETGDKSGLESLKDYGAHQ